jgi:serine/threonine protein kinase
MTAFVFLDNAKMINPGTKLGTYEVTSHIGSGGMGEVYQAHDSKLDRDVAIKVLPEQFARDSERLARFQREAKLLAAVVNGRGGSFEIGAVKPLFGTRALAGRYSYDVTADGQRFLLNSIPEQAASAPITVVVNWTAGVRK